MVVELQDMNSIKTDSPVLFDFYTSTCAPCRAMAPVLEEISKEFADVTVAKVEVTKHPQISQKYGVISVPTLIFIKDSKIKEVTKGMQNKASIKAMLEKHVGTRKYCS